MKKKFAIYIALIAAGVFFHFVLRLNARHEFSIPETTSVAEKPKVRRLPMLKEDALTVSPPASIPPQIAAPGPENEATDDPVTMTADAISEVDTIEINDPNSQLALMALAMSPEIDADMATEYFKSIGAKGIPALGALAGRIQEQNPEKSQVIVDQLFEAIASPEQAEADTMLVAEALMNAKSESIPDRIYGLLQNEADDRVRFKLYGALTGKDMNPELKEEFKKLALSDASDDIKELGRQWDRLIENKPNL